ncbi:MAG: hypothetical protein AUH42_00155 [Gemmatimonadetes bacterium 13_1_40CM_70_11]|nr:MAG: hypothetical protein AUH42_00155 [Gemmatimonadetes bacterium 13_1_40CM_70_11]
MWYALASCGGHGATRTPVPQPTAPLPTATLAGQQVSLFPLTLLAAEDSLHWEAQLADRHATLAKADSVISTLIKARAPEVTWVLPQELRRAARRAPSVATDPDQMGTALLRVESVEIVPDPLRSQLRTLEAIAGGRYALIPAALIYRRTVGLSDSRMDHPSAAAAAAELSVVMVDVRLGRVSWRTVARGEGNDPWSALTRAVKNLTPGLP